VRAFVRLDNQLRLQRSQPRTERIQELLALDDALWSHGLKLVPNLEWRVERSEFDHFTVQIAQPLDDAIVNLASCALTLHSELMSLCAGLNQEADELGS
jgi:hypothetical protein